MYLSYTHIQIYNYTFGSQQQQIKRLFLARLLSIPNVSSLTHFWEIVVVVVAVILIWLLMFTCDGQFVLHDDADASDAVNCYCLKRAYIRLCILLGKSFGKTQTRETQ